MRLRARRPTRHIHGCTGGVGIDAGQRSARGRGRDAGDGTVWTEGMRARDARAKRPDPGERTSDSRRPGVRLALTPHTPVGFRQQMFVHLLDLGKFLDEHADHVRPVQFTPRVNLYHPIHFQLQSVVLLLLFLRNKETRQCIGLSLGCERLHNIRLQGTPYP